MRKMVTIGLTSGKVMSFQILEDDAVKVIERLITEDGHLPVDFTDIIIVDNAGADVLFIRPSQVEMLSIGAVPPPKKPKSNLAIPIIN